MTAGVIAERTLAALEIVIFRNWRKEALPVHPRERNVSRLGAMTRDARALLILSGVILATSLPFIHAHTFVDDYYFVTMAKGISKPHAALYFKSDDAGIRDVAWVRGMRPRMVNLRSFTISWRV